MALSPNASEHGAGSPPGYPAERRAEPRFHWKGTVSIRILPNGPDVAGVLLDVSEGGCGIELGMAIPAQVGAKVKVDLYVHGLTLKRMGILRSIQIIRRMEKETRAGIEFIADSGLSAEQFRVMTKGLIKLVEENPSTAVKEKPQPSWWTRLTGLGG